MGKFGDIALTYKERFVILFSLNNLPSHDMKTAQMFRDLGEPLRFDDIQKFDDKDEGDECVIDFETAPQFLMVIPSVLQIFFTRFGYPPPVAQEALDLMARLETMAGAEDEPPEKPVKKRKAKQAQEDEEEE